MKNATLQALMADNALIITNAHRTIKDCINDAKLFALIGEKAFSVAAYKEADKFRALVAKRVVSQVAMKTEMAYNNTVARIEAKKSKLFGAAPLVFSPEVISVDMEAALDEMMAEKFPAKADTRPADHPSFTKAA